MITHKLKIWPEYFHQMASGKKKSELRLNDRMYAENDKVILREYDPKIGDYTGSYIEAHVACVTEYNAALKDNYVMLCLRIGEIFLSR